MGTFISSLILYGFAAAVLGLIGKLIYDIQQSKKEDKESDNEFEAKDKFQTLAGIKPHNPSNKTNELVSAMLNAEKLKEEFKDVEFPAPDPSIPVITAKLTTIGGDYGDSDPLASVPMSRVSKKAKQKMAEIAKQDISENLEEKTKSIFPEAVEYTDEYFKPDYSNVKPKRKYTKKKTK
jgi:hypothetical protein